MKPKYLGGHHLPTHGVNIGEYEELVKSQTKLQKFKMANGFTDKLGQCGFCMKEFLQIKALKQHRYRYRGCIRKTDVGKSTKADEKQLPKPDDKSAKRKGVRLQFTIFSV